MSTKPNDPRSLETREAVLALIAAFVRSDQRDEWSLAELECLLSSIPALTVSDAVAELAMHGVIAVAGETVSVCPSVRYLARVGVLGVG
jgi:hypothetical protein